MKKIIIGKYTFIVCRVFFSHDVLYEKYFHTHTRHRLTDINNKLHDIINLPNVVGAIGGTYILWSSKL